MSLCDVLINFAIGIGSGLLSGFISSICLKKRWDRIEKGKKFESEKQIYSRYLNDIRNEIAIGKRLNDYTFVLRSIENEPIREMFDELDALSQQSITEISRYVRNLKEIFEEEINSDSQIMEVQSQLLKYRLEVLKYRKKISR